MEGKGSTEGMEGGREEWREGAKREEWREGRTERRNGGRGGAKREKWREGGSSEGMDRWRGREGELHAVISWSSS